LAGSGLEPEVGVSDLVDEARIARLRQLAEIDLGCPSPLCRRQDPHEQEVSPGRTGEQHRQRECQEKQAAGSHGGALSWDETKVGSSSFVTSSGRKVIPLDLWTSGLAPATMGTDVG